MLRYATGKTWFFEMKVNIDDCSLVVCISAQAETDRKNNNFLRSVSKAPAHPFGQAVLAVEFPAHPEDREDHIG